MKPPSEQKRKVAHLAIIMDGNRRWASSRGLPVFLGHKAGVEALKRTIEACLASGVKVLTAFVLSTENWNRPEGELKYLLGLLQETIRAEMKLLQDHKVKVRFLGESLQAAFPGLYELFAATERETEGNDSLLLQVALNYGGRADILQATRSFMRQALEGTLAPENLTEGLFERALLTGLGDQACLDPDLLIRTGGEQRLSNYLLWPLAYTELLFLPILWPDFGLSDFEASLAEFQGRDRRFGS